MNQRSKSAAHTLQVNPRPDWMNATAFSLLLEMLHTSDPEGQCWESIETLAWKCNVSRSTVDRTLKELKVLKVLIVHSGKQFFNSSIYEVQIDRLLADLPAPKKHSTVGDVAHFFTDYYYKMARTVYRTSKNTGRKNRVRVQAGWQQRWAYIFQNYLDEGRTQEQINTVVARAFSEMPVLAARGPQCLKRHFDKLLKERIVI